MWADHHCAPNRLDTCFTIPTFANVKGQVTAGEVFYWGTEPDHPHEPGWSRELAPEQLDVSSGSSSGTGAGAMLEDVQHLSQTFVQAALRPFFTPTSQYIQWSLFGAEQSKDVRFSFFTTGGLKPEGFPTSQCVNKVHQSLCPAGLTSP